MEAYDLRKGSALIQAVGKCPEGRCYSPLPVELTAGVISMRCECVSKNACTVLGEVCPFFGKEVVAGEISSRCGNVLGPHNVQFALI